MQYVQLCIRVHVNLMPAHQMGVPADIGDEIETLYSQDLVLNKCPNVGVCQMKRTDDLFQFFVEAFKSFYPFEL